MKERSSHKVANGARNVVATDGNVRRAVPDFSAMGT
jgi:hypothetical protein